MPQKRSWPNGWHRPTFDALCDTVYGWRCCYPDNLILGERTDVGYGSYVQAEEGVTIGEDTQIGGHCEIYSVDTEGGTRGKVCIGKDCLIGSRCTILPGSVIPDGSRIRIGSVVFVRRGFTVVKEPVYRERVL